jgi:hypothetical protein
VDELDTWRNLAIGEESQVPEASSPSLSVTHFDQ